MAITNPSFAWVLTKRTVENVYNFAVPILGWSNSAQKLVTLAVDASGNLAVSGSPAGLGQATSANSSPVVIASDQSAVTTKPSTVTANFVSVAASTTSTIPIGAKGWSITFLTGTGTFGGVAVSAGFSDSDTNTLGAAITYTTASASTAYVRYGS